jgi:tRNA G18 (ribose-2'-O)-methylase SpoU
MSIKKTMSELERLTSEEFKRTDKLPIVVVLDEVRSMHNVGSVFRTSDAFLVQSIYLCGFTPQPPHRDIQKTALGSTETVTWKHVEDTQTAVLQLKQEGYAVYAIEQVHGSIPLHEFVLKPSVPHAFVFGNEVNGVADEVVELCDGVLEIPQLGSKHSLNISVSAGIVLWEMAKKYFV